MPDWPGRPPGGGGGSPPGGSVGQIQFNAGGSSFGGYTGTQVTALLDLFSTTTTTKGLVPGSNNVGTTNFLRADGAWAVPPGGGGGGATPFSVQTSIVGNPASTAETTLLSYTLPANSVSTLHKGLKISAAGFWGSDSRQAAIRVYFGSFVFSLLNVAIDGTFWAAEIIAILSAVGPTREMIIATGHASFPVVPLGVTNATVDMTAPVLINVTGQGPGAAIANEAVCYQLVVEPIL